MRRITIALIVVATLVAATAPATGQQPGSQEPPIRSGAQAIEWLGPRLPAVAADHGMSRAVLETTLRSDPSLHVDESLALLYIDEGPDGTAAPGDRIDPRSYDLDQTFALHSRPEADRVLYLHFGGLGPGEHPWTGGYSGDDDTLEPFTLDTDDTTFSDDELAFIQETWRGVAEDFAPFDVDVTTQQPPAEDIIRSGRSDQRYGTRVVFTSSATTCGCGGIAFVDTFDRVRRDGSIPTPALVYTRPSWYAKWATEVGSHEAGHVLGLRHDGYPDSAYYPGHGHWGPIMGVSYTPGLTQWSRGEYSGANNTEDDLAVMAGNGAPLRADDHGGPTAPTVLGAGETATGLIELRTDVDAFAFALEGERRVTVQVDTAAVMGDLDVGVQLIDAGGRLVGAADPPSSYVPSSSPYGPQVADGLDATLVVELPAGSYRVLVDGVGYADPRTTGWSDYASLGAYAVTVTTEERDPDAPPLPTAPAVPTDLTVTGTEVPGQVQVSWTPGGEASATAYELERQTQAKNRRWGGTTTLSTSDTSLTDDPGPGTHQYRVRATNSAGTSAWTEWVAAAVS